MNKDKNNTNNKEINKVLTQADRVLKVVFFILIIVGIYGVTLIMKEWKVLSIINSLLLILSPLFIGIVIAWLFDPIVTFIENKKINRTIGSIIMFLIAVLLMVFIMNELIPILVSQFNELVKTVPSFIKDASGVIDSLLNNIGETFNMDITSIKTEMILKIQEMGLDITEKIPGSIFNFIGSTFSFIGTFLMGTIIGFYLLIGFKTTNENIFKYVKNKEKGSIFELLQDINNLLKRFVKGSLINSLIIFAVSSIAFSIIGLKAAVLFGLFCGLTNIIPYVGPYIGGIPAVLVGLSQSVPIGIIVLIIIVITQTIDGNFLQPMIMSKSANLHPATVIIGLVIFGSLLGILGMIIAPPVLGSLKLIWKYLNKKYQIIKEPTTV